MLKAEIQKNAEVSIEAIGPLPEIVSDVATLIASLHSSMKKSSSVEADIFKAMIRAVVMDDSTVWQHKSNGTGFVAHVPMKKGE